MQSPPTDRSTAAKSSIAIIATFGCLACAFFLIAATIVLALIPIYTSSKSVTVNTSGQKSKLVELLLGIDSTARRKRGVIDNGTYDGCSLGSSGISDYKSTLLSHVPSYVKDITINSATIVQCTSSGRKRRSLSKRGAGRRCLRFLFYIIYQDICATKCQLLTGNSLAAKIKAIDAARFPRKNYSFVTSTGSSAILSIIVATIFYISSILPGVATATPSYFSTITTTTASVTTGMVG